MTPPVRKDIGGILREGTLIEQALNTASREAARLHKRLGQPLVVWRNGQTILIPPDEIDDGDETVAAVEHK